MHGSRVIDVLSLLSFIHIIMYSLFSVVFFHWGGFLIFKIYINLLMVHIESMSAYRLKIRLSMLIFCRSLDKMFARKVILPG